MDYTLFVAALLPMEVYPLQSAVFVCVLVHVGLQLQRRKGHSEFSKRVVEKSRARLLDLVERQQASKLFEGIQLYGGQS